MPCFSARTNVQPYTAKAEGDRYNTRPQTASAGVLSLLMELRRPGVVRAAFPLKQDSGILPIRSLALQRLARCDHCALRKVAGKLSFARWPRALTRVPFRELGLGVAAADCDDGETRCRDQCAR